MHSDIPVMWRRHIPVINHQMLAIVLILIAAFVPHAIDVQVTATGGSSGPGCRATVSNACGSLGFGNTLTLSSV